MAAARDPQPGGTPVAAAATTAPDGQGVVPAARAHCAECQGIVDWFGMTDEDAADVYRWHEDHPDWRIEDAERAAFARHEGSGA